MKVWFVASEAYPFAKTGGLADVIGSLPKELSKQGMDVRVIIPKYEAIPAHFKEAMEAQTIVHFDIQLGWRKQYCGIQSVEYEGVIYYFMDNEYYFKRSGFYGYDDEVERYAFFCRGAIECLPLIDFQPDVIHCHDWQSGLVPVLLNAHYRHLPFFASIKTVMTIHNLKYQGVFAKSKLQDLLGLSDEYLYGNQLELYGGASFLKGGLQHADKITTVSPSYANEIQQPYYGEHLDSLLRWRHNDLRGILNGIDYELHDPMNDPNLYMNYRDSLPKKRINKTRLQERLGLPVNEDVPMIALVTRLVQQKGLDLIAHVWPQLMELNAQFVILGTGEYRYEEMFRHAAREHGDKVSAQIVFDESLARQVYAASDLFLMPSQFEPCGIGQLIALRYRSVPIVRETGGLKDTVISFNEFTGEGTGFSFANYNAHEMLQTIKSAVYYYIHDREAWLKLMRNIKKCDFSWRKSAQQYVELYESMKDSYIHA
jgi:starch synthase